MTRERVSRPLSRFAEILVESGARVSLNKIRDLLVVLDAWVRTEGLRVCQINSDDRSVALGVGPSDLVPT
jgi:hypothetical protein